MKGIQRGRGRALRIVRVTTVIALMASCTLAFGTPRVSAATVTANVFADPIPGQCATSGTGNCSLREAVMFANANPGTAISLLSGTYSLTIGPSGADDDSTGDLNLLHDVTIAGARNSTVIDGGGMSPRDRIFTVGTGVNANLSNLTIRDGQAVSGAGIYNDGTVILTGVSVLGNTASADGGGIYNDGTLTVDGSTIGGATPDGNSAVRGGGIFTTGAASTALIRDSSAILGNQAVSGNITDSGCGGGIFTMGSQVSLDGSIIGGTAPGTANVSNSAGGSIFESGGSVTVQNGSRIVGNIAAPRSPVQPILGGGGIAVNNGGSLMVIASLITGNMAPEGAGINYSGAVGDTFTMMNAVVSGNAARASGGGIDFEGGATATVTNSVIAGNTAVGAGGGILTRENLLTVTGSTISGNTANQGGGISNPGGVLSLINTTVSGNSAAQDGGGIYTFGTTDLRYVTIANNNTGIYARKGFQGQTTTVTASLFANMSADCSGNAINSGDYNLASDASCTSFTQPHDLMTIDPHISSLADNGGPTLTHALLPGSLAIDAGGTSANSCPVTDQRGIPRPQGAACDIGAYEFFSPPPPVPRPGASPPPGAPPPAPAPSPRSGGPAGQSGPTNAPTPNPLPPHR